MHHLAHAVALCLVATVAAAWPAAASAQGPGDVSTTPRTAVAPRTFAVPPGTVPAPGAAPARYGRFDVDGVARRYRESRALMIFLPPSERPGGLPVLFRLDLRPQLALGYVGPTQGRYSEEQTLLDITQGTRVSLSAYSPADPPQFGLAVDGRLGLIAGWPQVVERAEAAEARLEPGLLASSVPGGAAYAGVDSRQQKPAVVAADRDGAISEVSLGSSQTLAMRAQRLLAQHRFVVVALPASSAAGGLLDALLRSRARNEVVIAMQTPPDVRSPVLLPIGIAGLGPPRGLTSVTTRRAGIVAGIDILPTVLDHLGVPVPDNVRGQPIVVDGTRDSDALRAVQARWRVVGDRRIPALETVLMTWLAVLAVCGVAGGAAGFRRGLRIGGLTVMWIPAILLLTALLEPGRRSEINLIALVCVALAVVCDLRIRWPRAPLVPAVAGLAAYAVDLFNHSELIVRSLLGPNPRFGSRYFGLGNELEATLPILLYLGLAVLLHERTRSRAGAAAFAVGGLALGVLVGSGRLGADVGGVLTIGAGAAVATLWMLPGGFTRRRVLIAVLVPALAVAALAAVDVLTGGNAHFTRTVLGSGGLDELWQTVQRRYDLAYAQLVNENMPYLTAGALLLSAYAIANRARLFANVADSPAWGAALAGGLTGSIVGALTNDSGPLLLVFGVFSLLFVTAYLRGDPRLGPVRLGASDSLRAARARLARRRSPAPPSPRPAPP